MKKILKTLIGLVVACGLFEISTLHMETAGWSGAGRQTGKGESHDFAALFVVVPRFIARLDSRSGKLPGWDEDFEHYYYDAYYEYPPLWTDNADHFLTGKDHSILFSRLRISRWKELPKDREAPPNALAPPSPSEQKLALMIDYGPFSEPTPLPGTR